MAPKKTVTDQEILATERKLTDAALAELRRRGVTDAEIRAFQSRKQRKPKK